MGYTTQTADVKRRKARGRPAKQNSLDRVALKRRAQATESRRAQARRQGHQDAAVQDSTALESKARAAETRRPATESGLAYRQEYLDAMLAKASAATLERRARALGKKPRATESRLALAPRQGHQNPLQASATLEGRAQAAEKIPRATEEVIASRQAYQNAKRDQHASMQAAHERSQPYFTTGRVKLDYAGHAAFIASAYLNKEWVAAKVVIDQYRMEFEATKPFLSFSGEINDEHADEELLSIDNDFREYRPTL